MKIFDTFLFFNEIDLLEIRLNILYSFVDYFVINESKKTFSGISKPLFYQENKDRFKNFQDKIIHNVVEIPDNIQNCWDREIFQRNSCITKLEDLCDPDDIIITNDVDEIPNPEILENLNNFYQKNCLYHLKQKFFMYYINNHVPGNWFGSRICDFEFLKQHSVDDIRQATEDETKLNGFIIDNGGWHFTYLGGEEKIKTKIESFSHQEYNNEIIKTNISKSLETNTDIFGRNKKFEILSLEESEFPKFIVLNRKKYSHLIKDDSN